MTPEGKSVEQQAAQGSLTPTTLPRLSWLEAC